MAHLRKQTDMAYLMARLAARLGGPLLRFLFPASGRHRAGAWSEYAYVHHYSCEYVGGPRPRPAELPLHGDDSPLVRPYVLGDEWSPVEVRRQRARRRALWLAVHGVDVGPRRIHGVEVAA